MIFYELYYLYKGDSSTLSLPPYHCRQWKKVAHIRFPGSKRVKLANTSSSRVDFNL